MIQTITISVKREFDRYREKLEVTGGKNEKESSIVCANVDCIIGCSN